MEGNKLYRLSDHAEGQYRLNAKRDRFIEKDVLERRISSLIYASKDRDYYSDSDGAAYFGACVITFSGDLVTDIHWINENHVCSGISRSEKDLLLEAYCYFGLNRNGNRNVKKKEDN